MATEHTMVRQAILPSKAGEFKGAAGRKQQIDDRGPYFGVATILRVVMRVIGLGGLLGRFSFGRIEPLE